jgi:uronate dehydrogenase
MILVTGASGFIGRQICPHLEKSGFKLRAFDRSPHKVVEDCVVGNLEDLERVRVAAKGVNTIIHLAACSDDADFITQLIPSNVVGLYNLFEAARLEEVRRIIFASSCQVADLLDANKKIMVDDRHPTDHYGLTKLWGEDMARMYSQRWGLSVLVVRLGWVLRSRRELAHMQSILGGTRIYLSYRDLQEFFRHCLDADLDSFSIVYAFSRQVQGELFDMEPTRRLLGFEPIDEFPQGLEALSKEM